MLQISKFKIITLLKKHWEQTNKENAGNIVAFADKAAE